jgi:hypothetical protein
MIQASIAGLWLTARAYAVRLALRRIVCARVCYMCRGF